MRHTPANTIEPLLQAILNRDGSGGGNSTIPSLHCQQMRDYGSRGGGIEFAPVQDPFSERADFINKLVKDNELLISLDHVWDAIICRGEILWLYLPNPQGGYHVDFFIGGENNPDPEYKVFYTRGGREISRVVLTYSYDQELAPPILGSLGGNTGYYGFTPQIPTNAYSNSSQDYARSSTWGLNRIQKMWMVLVIDPQNITQYECFTKPDLNIFMPSGSGGGNSGSGDNNSGSGDRIDPNSPVVSPLTGLSTTNQVQTYANPFAPEIPVKISRNNARRAGQPGTSDFHWMANLLSQHEQMLEKMLVNLSIFASPTLVTTRQAQDVLTQSLGGGGFGGAWPSWAGENRFYDNYGTIRSGSTHPKDVPGGAGLSRDGWGIGNGISSATDVSSIAPIIGGIQNEERFGYIQPPAPVPGEFYQYIKQFKEELHWCLGGLDPLGSQPGTFGEFKSLQGRIELSSHKKARALYEYGLCAVFEACIGLEERKFKAWLFANLKQNFPKRFEGMQNPDQITDDFARTAFRGWQQGQLIFKNAVPGTDADGNLERSSYAGLVPAGDRTVAWRYLRPVYLPSPQDELNYSIIARNNLEAGYNVKFVLRKENPDMTDKEIQQAQSGFAMRTIEAQTSASNQIMQLYQFYMSQPDPEYLTNPQAFANSKGQIPPQPPPWGIRLQVPQLCEKMMTVLNTQIQQATPDPAPALSPPDSNPNFQSLMQQIFAKAQQQQAQQQAQEQLLNQYYTGGINPLQNSLNQPSSLTPTQNQNGSTSFNAFNGSNSNPFLSGLPSPGATNTIG